MRRGEPEMKKALIASAFKHPTIIHLASYPHFYLMYLNKPRANFNAILYFAAKKHSSVLIPLSTINPVWIILMFRITLQRKMSTIVVSRVQ